MSKCFRLIITPQARCHSITYLLDSVSAIGGYYSTYKEEFPMPIKRMSRRDFLKGLTAATAIPLISACAPAAPGVPVTGTDTGVQQTGAVDTAVRSGGIQYDQKAAMYSQEPITLEVWDWHTPRIDMWNRWYENYTALYPNVQFNVTQVPFAEYQTKLPAAIPAGEGPDMFFLKWSFHPTLVTGGMVAPYPDESFPRSVLAESFEGFPMNAGPEGRAYWLPVGVMSGGIFRNVALWEEAGLTDDDIPETWDELVEVAKTLTKFDSAGRMTQSGLNINGAIPSIMNYLIYQQGVDVQRELHTAALRSAGNCPRFAVLPRSLRCA
jgi:multiple sugar transport system substrate-binding protein